MRKCTICVDLDGVLADFSNGWLGVENIGPPLKGAKDFLIALREFSEVIIFTTRCCAHVNNSVDEYTPEMLKSIVEEWLNKHEMPFDSVYIGQGKPIASAYIDDRAIECVPQLVGTISYKLALLQAIEYCRINHDNGVRNGE